MIDSILIEENNNYEQITNIINKRINVEKSLCTVDRDARPHSIEDRDELFFQKQLSLPHYIKIDAYQEILNDPYFARLDYKNSTAERNTCYIGKKAYIDNDNIIIHDWRSSIGQAYYNKANLTFSYRSEICKVVLRRIVDVNGLEINSYKNEYVACCVDLIQEFDNDNLTDPFLIEVLKEKRNNNKLTDIIETIQSNQNKIITLPSSINFVVQGCAGSGKTMVLLHRLSYLKYNGMLSEGNTIILTPNEHFNDYISDLSRMLELQNIRRYSIDEYYNYLLDKYYSMYINFSVFKAEKFISDDKLSNDFITCMYSMETYVQLRYVLLVYLKDFYDELEISRISQIANNYIYDKLPKKKRTYKTLAEYYRLIKSIKTKNQRIQDTLDKIQNELEKLNQEKAKKEKEINDIINPQISSLKLQKKDIEEKLDVQISSYFLILNKRGLLDNNYCRDVNLFNFNKHLESIINTNIINQEEHSTKSSIMYMLMDEIKNDNKKQFYAQQNYIKQKEEIELIIIQLEKELSTKHKFNPKYYFISKKLKEYKLFYQSTNDNFSNDYKKNYELIVLKEKKLEGLQGDIEGINKKIVSDNEIELLKSKVEIINKYNIDLLEINNQIQKLYSQNYLNSEMKEIYDEVSKKEALIEKTLTKLLPKEEIKIIESKLSLFSKLEPEKLYKNTFGEYINFQKKKYNLLLEKHYYFEKYLLLHFCSIYYGPIITTDLHISIDEAQDISVAEINMIKNVNNKSAVYNLYGDVEQVVNHKGISKWEDISFIYNFHYLKENFRNTNQITIFSNEKCNTNMQAIGLEGSDVKTINNFDIFENTIKLLSKTDERVAVIINNTDANFSHVRRFINHNNLINISILSVVQSKGLEFEKTFVFSNPMTLNEKYVSFTRALKELTIVDI